MKLSPEEVFAALRRARGSGISLKALQQQLHLQKDARNALRTVLSQLQREGKVAFDGNLYRTAVVKTEPEKPKIEPRKMGNTVLGVIKLKSEGYGFVSPLDGDGNRDNDLFIPPQHVNGALDGDVVRARAIRGRDGRLAGEVLEIVEQRRQMLLGIYQARGKGAWVIPHDRTLTENVSVARHAKARDGEMVKVRLHREHPGALSGEVIEVLGNRGDPRFEMLASAYAEGFNDQFDAATRGAAENIPEEVQPDETVRRRDLRHLPLVTIDGEDARDFDDAVHVSQTPSGYRLVVAIADVAHYVRPGSPIDREALKRATSVYFPGMVLPMLPERLSNGICSLNPGVDRLCMVADLALDKNGHATHADIYDAVMRSHARLTYTKVAAALEGHTDAQTKPLLPDLKIAHELSKKLTQMRKDRGSIDFDLPEAKILLDEEGKPIRMERRPRNDAHRLVEEFMLAANEAVARFFEARGLPTVYRVHGDPDPEKLEAFAALARSHGFELPSGDELTADELNKFLHAVEGKPAQKALNSLLLRAMMQAVYSPENIGHFGLAAPSYLHFTSPIRRYPDLMVHRLLKEHWARGGQPLRQHERDEQEEYLKGISLQCSDRERAAMKAERDVDAFYAALYMQDKVGESYDAVVSGLADFGVFCELTSIFVEGLLPKESLGEDAEFDKEQQRMVVGRSGKSYSVGDKLKVTVESADPARRRITLALQSGAQPKTGKWLTPEDLQAQPAPKPKKRLPRASPPPPKPRHGGRRGRGR